MRIKFTFLIMAIIIRQVYAQDFTITFSGEGVISTVDSVMIDNLMQGTSKTVKGDETLHLLKTPTAIIQAEDLKPAIIIYPNPGKGSGFVDLNVSKSGNSLLEILDLSGKQVAKLQTYLEIGWHSIAFKGLAGGLYLLSVETEEFVYSDKIASQAADGGDVQLLHTGLLADPIDAGLKALKNSSSNSIMQYNTGDRLKFTGYSGNYSEVQVDIPTGNKSVEFKFMDCTDGDQNHYPVVTIGTQIWMADNLKTTHYIDGTPIPLEVDNAVWEALRTPGYCWYNNDIANLKDTYGALYNWYAVGTGKLCPTNWHVPADMEWTILTDYLGGANIAGSKLEENGNSHWKGYEYCARTNETGFEALPGGYRAVASYSLESLGFLWSATESGLYSAFMRFMRITDCGVGRSEYGKRSGFSIRCVKNTEIPTEDLIAWYPLNGNATDFSGKGNNGTVYGAAPASDRFGNPSGAMVFDGIDDYIDLPDNNLLGQTLTFSAWVKQLPYKTKWARIIEYGNGENKNNIGIAVSTENTKKPCFLVCNTDGCDIITGVSELQDDTWVHIAFTVNGNLVKCYINGELVVQTNTSKPHDAVNRTINYIGRSNFSSDNYAHAVFDNIRVYTRELSHVEIIALTGE